MQNAELGPTINSSELFYRQIGAALLSPIFRAESIIQTGAVERAEILLPCNGLIVYMTHPGARDPLDVAVQLSYISPKIFRRRRMVVPTEKAQAVKHPYLEPLGRKMGINVFALSNSDTAQKVARGELSQALQEEGKRSIDYVKTVRTSLENGQILLVATDEGRRPSLKLNAERKVGPLDFILKKRPDLNPGIMFVTFGINETNPDFSNVHSLNVKALQVPYTMRIGPTFTANELRQIGADCGWNLDEVGKIIHSTQVQPEYNQISPEDTKKYLDYMQTKVVKQFES